MTGRPHPESSVLPASSDASAPLLAEIRSGDLKAIAAAYDCWHQGVRVLARRLLSDDAAAEDVVQEVFVALPKAIHRFRGEVPLESFLLGIAVKRARHHLRTAVRRRRALAHFSDHHPMSPRNPEQQAYRRQLADRLTAALDLLPALQREAFVLCEVEGLSALAASVLVSAPEPTVRTRLFHARRRLRDLLSAERGE